MGPGEGTEEHPQHQDLAALSSRCGKTLQHSLLRTSGLEDSTLH